MGYMGILTYPKPYSIDLKGDYRFSGIHSFKDHLYRFAFGFLPTLGRLPSTALGLAFWV